MIHCHEIEMKKQLMVIYMYDPKTKLLIARLIPFQDSKKLS